MPLSYKFLLFFHFYYQYQNPPDTSYIVEETIWYLRITNLSERKLLSWLIIWNTKSLNNIFFLTYFVSVIIICQPLVQGIPLKYYLKKIVGVSLTNLSHFARVQIKFQNLTYAMLKFNILIKTIRCHCEKFTLSDCIDITRKIVV